MSEKKTSIKEMIITEHQIVSHFVIYCTNNQIEVLLQITVSKMLACAIFALCQTGGYNM